MSWNHKAWAVKSDISCSYMFSDISPRARETKEKLTNGTTLHWKDLHSKGDHQQNEKPTHSMGEHIHQWYIWEGVNIQNV